MRKAGCELCDRTGGELLWQGARLRVVYVEEPGYPGFCRVIWEAHAKEMTDLSEDDRMHLMEAVFAVESVLREHLEPDKINLASLGNVVPHLHWHVVPRYLDDPHFPQPIWSSPQRAVSVRPSRHSTAALASAIADALE
jgi:diadenosine tetraphosphate (Ap4A) HIT family hydrolase